jgi:chloramphenicol O-acetyltransferase type A
MRQIDLAHWPRREHFRLFSGFDYPHTNWCANVTLSTFYDEVKRQGLSFNVATIYVIARAANDVPELRQRIRGDCVVEHDVVHPSTTILARDDLFSFCTILYCQPFAAFAERAAERITAVQLDPTVADEPGQDDLLFMTAIPWVSFTSVMHPLHWHPVDSVPRIAWGKYFREGDCLKMPLSLQAHHALVDGLHMGRFFGRVQAYLDDPAGTLVADA